MAAHAPTRQAKKRRRTNMTTRTRKAWHVGPAPVVTPELGQSPSVDVGERLFGDAYYLSESKALTDVYRKMLGGVVSEYDTTNLKILHLLGEPHEQPPAAFVAALKRGARRLGDQESLRAIAEWLKGGRTFGEGLDSSAWYDSLSNYFPGRNIDEARSAINRLLAAGGIDAIRHVDPNGGRALAVLRPQRLKAMAYR
jgi:hypothetical protein